MATHVCDTERQPTARVARAEQDVREARPSLLARRARIDDAGDVRVLAPREGNWANGVDNGDRVAADRGDGFDLQGKSKMVISRVRIETILTV